MLQEVVASEFILFPSYHYSYHSAMKEEDAKYHLDRCIKSGLWCPGGDDEGTCFTFYQID